MPRLLLAALALVALGCAAPAPPSHLTRLWPEGHTGAPLLGLSTEDGVVTLAMPDAHVDDVWEIQFPVGNSFVRDWGRVDRINDTLMVIRPITARLLEGRFATRLPERGETLYVALRDAADEPVMQPVSVWRDGEYGDWVLLPGGDARELAPRLRGAGLYVLREGRWQIAGLLAGLLAGLDEEPEELALGYIGLPELARILPDRVAYHLRNARPLRPDFEFGVPLQPGDIDLTPPETDEPAPAPTPAPAPR